LLFGLGFVPFVGQTVVPVIGFFVTGFFLTEELTSVALQRRRVEARDRLRLLRSRRTLVWGFGTPLALAFLVPFVAVFLMPGAVAGATLMARDLLGEETTGDDDSDDRDGRSGGGPGGGHAPRPRPADPWTKPRVR
uniref:EI24 domain-containing protein n=1 Tax=Streptomyces torulosus TaxID=68276 RepID=UPI000B2F6E5A